MRRPSEFVDFPPALQEGAMHGWGPYRAVVRQVVDGDTLDVLVDLGFQCYAYQTLRLHGVNAPERYTEAGRAAQGFLRGLLPPGTPVMITPHKDATTFGRYVAVVECLIEGALANVAAVLLEVGHAVRSAR